MQAPPPPDKFLVKIIGARGLRKADWSWMGSKSDPYCICEVIGKPFKFQTEVMKNTVEPIWNAETIIDGIEANDKLCFTIFDKDTLKRDDLLGTAELAATKFKNGGYFNGDLALKEAGEGIRAYLRIRIEPVDEVNKLLGLSPTHRAIAQIRASELIQEMPTETTQGEREFHLRTVWTSSTTKQASTPPQATFRRDAVTTSLIMNCVQSHHSEGFLRHLICPPGSPYRLVWDVLGGVLILYDSLIIPLQVFELPENAYYKVMDLFTLVFWTLNMGSSLLHGYYRNGAIEMRFSKIACLYLRTWFLVDFAAVAPDWYFTLDALVNARELTGAQDSVKLLRITRLMRSLRLIRLLKLRWILSALTDQLNSESSSIIVNILKVVMLLLFINHFIACFWYLIGDWNYPTIPTWIEVHGFEGSSWDYLYLTSFHWSITQFTPASMAVNPQNSVERSFCVSVVVFALIVFSYLVGSITNSLSQLRSLQEESTKQFWTLRRYLKENQIPIDLSVRIQRYLEHAYQRHKSRVSEPKIWRLLSEQLQNEFQCERSVPHMVVHPLFYHLTRISNVTVQRLAVTAISRRALARGDRLFYPGETATHVYFVVAGRFRYVKVGGKGQPEEWVDPYQDWISEPVLWVPNWTHLGTLMAGTEAELLLVDGGKFGEIISLNPPVFAQVRQYAARFVELINLQSHEELSDISQGEDITDTLRAFIGEESQGYFRVPSMSDLGDGVSRLLVRNASWG